MEINRETLKDILNKTGIVANKNLGQNFLVDPAVSKNIVSLLNIDKDDIVLEVGPGLGSLTHFLSHHPLDVCDIDKRMCDVISSIYADTPSITVYNFDVLKFDVSKYTKIISNLPYYITSDIIAYLLINAINCKEMVFMVQKEAAFRFLDVDEKTEPLSVLINMVGEIKKEFVVKPSSFSPMPHVDSLVFKITINNKFDNLKNIYRFVKTMYLQKRKTIYNNLSSIVKNKQKAQDILTKLSLDPFLRPENLTKDDYLALYNEVYDNKR